jgi:gamma-glutamylcyclotransferase (GGCT)/AIG2-like uncharacterized protein YtfP
MKQLPIFVYGSLKSGKYNHFLYLEGKVKSKAKKSRIKAVLYDLPHKGYPAIISNRKNVRWVHGEVYDLIDFESTIMSLDKLENYYGKYAFNNEYEREIKEIEIWNIEYNKYECLKAFVYFYCEMKDLEFSKSAILMKDGSWPNKKA